MHNHDDKYPPRPGFVPGTSRLQAPIDTNEPPGPISIEFKAWSSITEDERHLVNSHTYLSLCAVLSGCNRSLVMIHSGRLERIAS